ncbi:MAG: chloride channel protein [Phycisphaerales bacterium]
MSGTREQSVRFGDGAGADPPRPSGEWRLLTYAAVFGVLMGLIALAFIRPIQAADAIADEWLRADPARAFWALPVVPAIGGLLCALVVRLLPLDLRGHGVSTVLYAVARRQSHLPLRVAIRQWLASTATIVTGGSAGPEGPIVTIGAALGSCVARWARLDRDGVTTLLGAGAAGGIAAVFNAPFAGVFFALEVLLRDFSIRTFAPIVVASVLSSAATQTIMGTPRPLFGADALALSSLRPTLTVAAVPAFAALGAACGLGSVLFIRAMRSFERMFSASPIPPFLRPAAGGLALGLCGAAYLALAPHGATSSIPMFMGNGYAAVEQLLVPATYEREFTTLAILLAAWIVLKTVGTSLTLGSGGSGGLFAPSLLLGALTGGLSGTLLHAAGLLTSVSTAHFALVGMAGAVAGTTHAPLSGIMLVYELTGDYGMILPLMLTATVATLVARSIERESAYTAVIAEQGVRLGTRGDQSRLRRLTVRDVTLEPPTVIRADDTADRILQIADRCNVGEFLVVDAQDRVAGVVGGRELRAALVHREALPLLQVSEIMRAGVPSVASYETLDVALDRFQSNELASLPVLDPRGRCEGLLTRERLMRRYHDEMERDA